MQISFERYIFMNIYVGNLPYQISQRDLEELFSEFGEVSGVKIIQDRETGRSKGFGFVEMTNDNEAVEAINNLEGQDVNGRNIKVNEARPREPCPRRPRY